MPPPTRIGWTLPAPARAAALLLAATLPAVSPIAAQVAAPVAPAAAQAPHFPADSALERMIRYLVEDSVTPGVVLGVLEADGTRRIVSWGSTGPDGTRPGPGTLFEIGSITKTFTATLLADMVRRGDVALDDPVARFLPDSIGPIARSGEEVTLGHLATHTSGLPHMAHRPADIYDPYADLTEDALLVFADTVELRDIPGHRYRYSNAGMALLGYALARAAGRPFDALVRERILEPLGMNRTTFHPDDDLVPHLARGHDDRGVAGYRTRTPVGLGMGGLYSTADDLLTWLDAQVGPPTSELEGAMRMTHEVRMTHTDGQQGLGWHVARLAGEPLLHHGGGSTGFTSQIAFDPAKGVGAVLLANVFGLNTSMITALVAQAPPPGWEVVAVEREALARWTGEYAPDRGDARFYVRLEDDGALTYQPRGLPRARLYPTSDSTFFLLRAPWSFTFRRDPATGTVRFHAEVDAREPEARGTRDARRVGDATPSPVLAAGGPWHRPPRGPGWAGAVALAAVVAGIVWLGPIRARRRARR